ncbi:unnamed protein product [Cladocopium goreaui]|uniref:Uncharacterized protein n=1 Tax=Cladocopium goreaui TaxID=2562237 RepID=A0A9P1CG19_9DINO|nr:unnamed protein product [Cladocopium goreaui]
MPDDAQPEKKRKAHKASGSAAPQTPPKQIEKKLMPSNPNMYKKATRGMPRFDLVSHGDTLTGESFVGIEGNLEGAEGQWLMMEGSAAQPPASPEQVEMDLLEVEVEEDHVPCFLLVVSKPDPELLLRYEALAMELMEFQNFHLAVDNGGEKWKDLPGTRPSIHFIANKELHLEAPPFELAFDQDLMRPWVIISSLPTVRHQINFYMWELIPIGWSVVVLRHHGDHDAVERFQERTKAMREALRYSFVHLDVSTESGNGFAMTFFPLIAAYWEDYIPYFTDVQDPRIFVFTKTHADGTLYWDSHYIDFPSPDDFQLEDVDQLMRKSPALDPIDFAEWPHWFLRYERFGGRSSVHRAIWLCAPFVSFYLFLYFSLWFFFFVRAIQESGLFSLFSLSGKASQAAPERVKKPKKGKKNR